MRINDLQVSAHFNLREFQCPCCHRVMVHPRLVRMLEKLRGMFGRPLILTSGYRCLPHNRDVGGVDHSLHMIGQAVDVAVMAIQQHDFTAYAVQAGFDSVLPNRMRNYVHLGIGGK